MGGTVSRLDTPHQRASAEGTGITLAEDGVVRRVSAPTRGGRHIGTWHLTADAGIRTAIERAATRKRLLTARHDGWAATSERNPKGLIGQAGETVVRRLLESLDPYSHIVWDAGHALGTHIPGGTVDASTFLTVSIAGIPTALTALVEVKNQRQWFYPTNRQLHRFLAKGANLQVANPGVPIVPVFVSSWRHDSTLRLGKLLGFYAISYRVQYVLDRAEIEPRLFTEVVQELGYSDLRRGVEPNINLRHALEISLPRDAPASARRWGQSAELVLPYAEVIRDTPSDQERRALLNELIEQVTNQLGEPAT